MTYVFDPVVTAALGPTNTGKTHLAVERMMAHASGVIGLPLRLLAREVYDRVAREKGPSAVALVTGEEKITPKTARYFVCTVEAMPRDRVTAFVAIDEIQLAADPDRGHVFTERLLHARGVEETMLLGAETMRPLIRALAPDAVHDHRERFSTLTHTGPMKLTRLPRRSAIVAFSAEEVYAIAELLRRQRGGAAVVMGALSPRTRNAQVELYQSGEVDFIVATDAIGMGLNLDVDHVAFASLRKFDGVRRRMLTPAEIAQIAGRAGRFRTDGTFGVTGDCQTIADDVARKVEDHQFEAVTSVQWRNADLDYSSMDALSASLTAASPNPALRRTREASDEVALNTLAEDIEIAPRLNNEAAVRRLWSACQLPDFRHATIDQHVRLISRMARGLLSDDGHLPEAWIGAEIKKLDDTRGEVDALSARLAHIRTWTYAANRSDWLARAEHWRDVARAVEDRLSDALHERLTQRFVDRRSTAILRGLRMKSDLLAIVDPTGAIEVEGHFVGTVRGLVFHADKRGDGLDARALSNAALKAVKPEIDRRLGAIAGDDDSAFQLDNDGKISWRGDIIARLANGLKDSGPSELEPNVRLVGGDLGARAAQTRAIERLEAWLGAMVARDLSALLALREAVRSGAVKGLARGLAHQLIENLGALERRAHDETLTALSAAERRPLRALGVRIGEHTVFMPALLKPAPARLLTLLFACGPRGDRRPAFRPQAGRASLPADPHASGPHLDAAYAAAGYRRCGPLAVRLDMLERLADELRAARKNAGKQPFAATPTMLAMLGCTKADLSAVLRALGYTRAPVAKPAPGSEPGAIDELWRAPRPRRRTPPPDRSAPPKPDSPFAALAELASSHVPDPKTADPSRINDAPTGERRASGRPNRRRRPRVRARSAPKTP